MSVKEVRNLNVLWLHLNNILHLIAITLSWEMSIIYIHNLNFVTWYRMAIGKEHLINSLNRYSIASLEYVSRNKISFLPLGNGLNLRLSAVSHAWITYIKTNYQERLEVHSIKCD